MFIVKWLEVKSGKVKKASFVNYEDKLEFLGSTLLVKILNGAVVRID